ncbi:hyalin-like [Patiria miniata]|uniref:Uncharacterized protein n=1 Tax=Patiria miniata TaxID=46514 RepID=A0A914B6Y3_PATMI|nr:hyalin-like [Patiria miniata]
MVTSAIRRRWCLCVMAVLCVYSGTTYGQAPPTFDESPCVEDIYIAAEDKSSVAGIAWIVPLAKDNSGQRAAVTCDKELISGQFNPGSNVVTCTAVDTRETSLTTQCSFEVHVLPKFEVGCPAPIIQNDTTVDFTIPRAVGSGGKMAEVTCNKNSGDSFTAGKTTVTCTATDAEKNLQAECSFDVTVGIPPTFDSNCTDFNVQPTAGKNEAEGVTLPTLTATQANGVTVTAVCRQADSETTFVGGETVVTCTAADTTEPTLITTCNYTVRVYPIFTTGCPGDIIQANGSTVDFPMPIAMDSAELAPNVICDNPVDGFDPGPTTVTCSAEDSEQTGQNVSCSFKVTIGDAPIFNPDPDCTQDVVVSPNSNTQARNVEWPERTANQSDGTAAMVECTPASGTDFEGGDTNVTCVAKDTAEETLITTCNFRVRVYPKFVELCPQIVPRTPDADDYRATIAHLDPIAEDQDGNNVVVTCEPPWGSKFDSKNDSVRCTAEQTPNETASCVTTVLLIPSLEVSTLVRDIDKGPDPGMQTAKVEWDLPSAIVPQPPPADVTCAPASGSTFQPGESDAKCVASWTLPGSGSVAEAVNKFKVRVFPIITCPADVVAAPNTTSPITTVDYPTATATDSTQSDVSVDCVPVSGSQFDNDAATNVTCNATDSVTGNEATCTFLVTVGEAPTFEDNPCHEQVNVPPDTEDGTASSVSWVDPTAMDRDNNTAAVTCTPASGTMDFRAGPTEVKCTAVDSTMDSLISTCIFNVFVSPTFNVSCPGDIVVSPSEAVVSPDWLQARGNMDTTGEFASVQCNMEAGAKLNETVTMITCTATDAGTDFTTNCSFNVTVDSSPPIMTCPADTTLMPDPGTNTANHTWMVNVTDDNTPTENISVLCIPESRSVFKYGSTEVFCFAVDSFGNMGTCTFDVNVTGAACQENCGENSVCTVNPDGESVCTCNEGFSGNPCKDIDECKVDKPCHADADCNNLPPPDFFKCKCKEGFYGDGVYSCEPYIAPEYPNITGSTDLEKKFSVVLAISTSSSYACDPESDKMSFQCLGLVNTLKTSVESLYRKVSPRSFKAVTVDQTAIKKGSVVIPHTVTYNYDYVEVRGIGPTEFLRKSTLGDALQAGAIGTLELVTNCADCSDPKDITDVCANADKDSITCTGNREPYEDKSDDHCILACVSRCISDPKYCNGGVCSQALDKDPLCGSCPANTGGPRCEPLEEEGPNIPLIVGLSVGLGGGALLIIVIGVIVFVYKKKTGKNSVSEFQEDNSRGDGVEALALENREYENQPSPL